MKVHSIIVDCLRYSPVDAMQWLRLVRKAPGASHRCTELNWSASGGIRAKLVSTYKAINGKAPDYKSAMFRYVSDVHKLPANVKKWVISWNVQNELPKFSFNWILVNCVHTFIRFYVMF